MNIQLNFSTKIIRIDSCVNFLELAKKLKTLLPDLKDWKLDSNSVISWYNPIIWDYRQPYVWVNPSPGIYFQSPPTGELTVSPPPTDCNFNNSVVNLQLN